MSISNDILHSKLDSSIPAIDEIKKRKLSESDEFVESSSLLSQAALATDVSPPGIERLITVFEEKVQQNTTVVEKLLICLGKNYKYIHVLNGNVRAKIGVLDKSSYNYFSIKAKFDKYGPKRIIHPIRAKYTIELDAIQEVINPYLTAQYELRKIKTKEIYGVCNEEDLFHGTSREAADIIKYWNFDWRLGGRAVGTKFGSAARYISRASRCNESKASSSSSSRAIRAHVTLPDIGSLSLRSAVFKEEVQKNTVVEKLLIFFDKSQEYIEVLKDNEIAKIQTLKSSSGAYINNKLKFNRYGLTRIVHPIRRRYTIKLEGIQKITNPYLTAHFELKKIKTKKTFSVCNEEDVFHGTSLEAAKKIIHSNFNWRLGGTHVGTKFGRGMSFSPKSTYASDYPHSNDSYRYMFLAKVVWAKKCNGHSFMTYPNPGYDTSIRPNGEVIVKYEDADYNPEYLFHYTRRSF